MHIKWSASLPYNDIFLIQMIDGIKRLREFSERQITREFEGNKFIGL